MSKNKSIEERFQNPQAVEALLCLLIDFWFAQPASTVLHVDHMMDAIDRGLDETLTEHWITTHLRPFIKREAERCAERDCRVADWVSPEMQAELRAVAMRPINLNRAFLREAVQQESVRHMLRSVIEETSTALSIP